MKAKVLEERMEPADDLAKKFKDERKRGKIEAEGKGPTVEKFEQNLEKLDQRIATLQTQSEDRENNKEVALGTSKIVSVDRFTIYYVSRMATDLLGRTTSILASPLSSPRSLTCPSSASSRRL